MTLYKAVFDPWMKSLTSPVLEVFDLKTSYIFCYGVMLCLSPQIHLNSRGLIFSVGLLLASVFFTVSTIALKLTECH